MSNGKAKLLQAIKDATEEATNSANECLELLQNAALVKGTEAEELFKQAANRALIASENWRKAAQNLIDTL